MAAVRRAPVYIKGFDQELWLRFRVQCLRRKKTAAELLEVILLEWLAGEEGAWISAAAAGDDEMLEAAGG
ncbi:MAG TPA: hypothetical protein VKD66_16315 [Streptosporangiaceae bacterium]|nr:hypothetical protein [Streptosporangiaceae bacterium]